MNTIPKIDLKSLSTRIRPPRYAVLVDINSKDWIKDCKTVIEWFSLHWGGLNNIIIPTDNNKIDDVFWSILEVFKPDYCIQYIPKEKYNQENKLSLNLVKELNGRLNLYILHQDEIKTIIHSTNKHNLNIDVLTILKDKGGYDFKLFDFNYKYDTYTELILRSKFGTFKNIKKIIEEYNNGLHAYYNLTDRKNKLTFELKYYDKDSVNEIQAFRKYYNLIGDSVLNTVYSLSNYGLRKYKFNYKNSSENNYYFVIGSSTQDFYLYNSIDKMTDNAFWIPEILESKNKIAFLRELFVRREYDFMIEQPKIKCHILSLTLEKDNVLELWNEFKNEFSDYDNIISVLDLAEYTTNLESIIKDINPLRTFEGDSTSEFYIDHFYNNYSMNPLKVPIPTTFKNLNSRDYNWYTDFDILSNTETSELKDGYILPSMSIFNADVFNELNNKTYSMVRFTGECISFYCPNLGLVFDNLKEFIIKPKIKLLEADEIFNRLFDNINIDYKVSDKGNYEHHSTNLFGSFENIYKDFKNENIVNLFEKFIDNKDSGDKRLKKEKKGICLINVKRVYYNYNEIKEFVKDDELTRNTIEKYLDYGILKRGIILKCKYCNNCNWYDFKILEQRFICSRCQNEQLITKENWLKNEKGIHSDEPTFYYSLNEIVYQGYSSCMRYPILTKGYLKNLTKQSFISIPEIEIKYKNAKPDEKGNEFDIICISDGEILIGEVKKKAQISENIGIYNDVCNKLNARFVLSTYAEKWERDAIEIIENKKWAKKPLILTRKELLAK